LKIALTISIHEIRSTIRANHVEDLQISIELTGVARTKMVIVTAFLQAFEKLMSSDNIHFGCQAAGLSPFNSNRSMESSYVRNKATEILAALVSFGSRPSSCTLLRAAENLADLKAALSLVFPED
jgi:hypothetical protein